MNLIKAIIWGIITWNCLLGGFNEFIKEKYREIY